MAGGHYERVQRINEDTGKRYWVNVWVADKPVAPPRNRPTPGAAAAAAVAARRAALAVAQARARRVAAAARRARKIRELALARQRHLAYEKLQQRAAEIRKAAVDRRTPNMPDRQADLIERRYQQASRQPRPKAPSVAAAKSAAEAAALKERQADLALVAQGLVKDRKATQEYVRDAAERARRGPVNTKEVEKVAERFASDANRVADRYGEMVKKLNKLIDAGELDQAQKLYKGAFRKVAREYEAYFGVAGDPRKQGAVREFFANYDSIYEGQQDWWKRQMQAVLDSDRASLQAHIADLRRRGENDEANKLAQLLAVYNGQTRTVNDSTVERDDGRPGTRKLTISEELERREAEKRIEAERIRAQMAASQRREEQLLRANGLVRSLGGQIVTPERDRVLRDMSAFVDREMGGKAPTIRRDEDLTAFADRLMSDWERRNPPPPMPPGGARASQAGTPAGRRLAEWRARRDAYEKEVYGVYEQTPRALWDRLFQLPGASHFFAAIQAPVSAIGAGGRVVLKATTGSSQLGASFGYDELPPEARRYVDDHSAMPAVALQSGRGREYQTNLRIQALNAWLATDTGRRWLAGWTKKHEAKVSEQDRAFLEGFYNSKEPGDALDALNKYGQEPFGNPLANLAFQLLADPTNAIPLKFTTYLARAHYASDLGKASTFARSSKLGWLRDFVKVDEGTLRARKAAEALRDEVGRLGLPDQQIVDRVMSEVVGIKSKTEATKAIEEKLRAAGVLERAKNSDQLLSLIEEQIGLRLEGTTHVTQADAIKKRLDDEAKARAAEDAKRKARQEAAGKRAKAEAEQRLKDSAQSESRLKQTRAAQVKRVKGELEALNKQGALSPAEEARRQYLDRVLRDVTGLSRDEWERRIIRSAEGQLRRGGLSTAEQARYRAIIRDVHSAREGRSARRVKGGVVANRDLRAHSNRVLAVVGREAKKYFAPKEFAFYAEDAKGVAVEYGRTLNRWLKAAERNAGPGEARLGKNALDHFPKQLWEEVNQEVSDAISEVRGFHADYHTRRKGAKNAGGASALGKMSDTDPRVVAAKKKVLDQYGISVAAYDEIRQVLLKPFLQARNAEYLLSQATVGGKFSEKRFLQLRQAGANTEALKRLQMLAEDEMFGAAPQDVLGEFISRYGDDGMLREFKPVLSPLQRRTLEEHLKEVSGVTDLADQKAMDAFLSSRNAPPVHSRLAMKDYLTKIGAWSPRTADTFTAGERSWSFRQEAEYMRTSYGLVPEWADEAALRDAKLNTMFDHEDIYYREHERWGYFDRSADIAIRQSDLTAKEVEELHIYGSEQLGLKARRELALRRKYAIDRWGDLIAEPVMRKVEPVMAGRDAQLVDRLSQDFNVQVTEEVLEWRLKRMPWLMTEDELRDYLSTRVASHIAADLIQNVDELGEVVKMIRSELDTYWEKYLGPKAVAGPIDHTDVFRLASKVQERLLQNPKWARRKRDIVGKGLSAWAAAQRAMVFSQISFLTANVVDVPIKAGWYRYTNRGLFQRTLANAPKDVVERARALTAKDLGLGETTINPKQAKRSVKSYFTEAQEKGIRRVVEMGTGLYHGVSRPFPEGAAVAETFGKVHLAQGMYPEVFAIFKAKGLADDVAHAGALRFIKKEVGRMWPTVGDHPLAKLFNQLVPFGTYMAANRVLFISEALAHPSILNQIEFIGRYIEQVNRENWAKEHPGEPLPDWAARRIELPWAPGYFLDLGVFSDATRGLAPLYKAAGGPQSYLDFAAQWVRLVNPGTQAGIYMLTNALGLTSRIRWRPVRNEQGFVTGYEKVVEGLTEPWSEQQPSWGSIFWPLEAIQDFQSLGAGGWTAGETSVFLGKLLMFDAVRGVDRGGTLFEVYKQMRDQNKELAERWLNTTDNGQIVKDWLAVHQDTTRDVADLFGLLKQRDSDPARWFHMQAPVFQRKVTDARNRLDRIRDAYDQRLLGLTVGTDAYKQTKAEMYLAISEVYRQTPELLIADVYSKDAYEWSQQLSKWQTASLVDSFFALDARKPKRAEFSTQAAYEKAVDAWERQKAIFLKTYPQVEQEVGAGRAAYQSVRDKMEADWDAVLSRTAARAQEIAKAEADGDEARANLLHLQQDLDYSLLSRDYVDMYFTPADYEEVRDDNTRLRDGAVKIAKVFLDFDQIRYQKAVREGRGEQFLRDADYNAGLKAVILKAKGGDPFGEFDPVKFVAAVKADPGFAAQYFAKHPGKQQEWAKTDTYIRLIGTWGRLARAGRWDAAERAWSALPQWVKDRYLAKHPEKRRKAVQSSQYVGWLKRWVAHFERDDVKGGMDFFWKMPEWVRERYFAKHPEKRAKWEAQMKYGAQLGAYFAADEANRPAYLADHPELKRFLKSAGMNDARAQRDAIIAGYRAIPADEPWLRRVYREKYPDVFGKEAQGERRLKKVYGQLAAHPEMLPAFERWVAEVWGTYEEMLKHPRVRAKSLELERERAATRRRHERGRSAAEVSAG